ncbi:CMPK1 [Auxenochlorella protothecoides x Auxenochlorella symbiontica]
MDIVRNGSRAGEARTPMSREKKALLKDQLELVKYKSGDGRSRYTIKPREGLLSFEKGSFMVVRAIQLLCSQNRDTILVGLAGPSGSGKTAFSAKIQSFIPDSVVLSMDMYNDGSKVIDGNFDDPRITDFDTLIQNITDLRAGRAAEVPIYDFKESRRVGTRRVEVTSSRVVILEGIYALSQRLRPMLDLRVSITGGVHFDLVKRVLRDINRSGQAAEDIIQQVSETVYPMYKAFIEPDLQAAHLRIHNRFNPFSGFMSPTYILKSASAVTEEQVLAVLAEGGDGAAAGKQDTTESYDIYLLPPNEDAESCASWLRMRYRDGRYSLMFEEWVVDGSVIISPRVTFEVPVRILGGLMALGYDVGTIMRRTSRTFSNDRVTIKLDAIEGMDRSFVQVQSKEREATTRLGAALGLEGTYIPHSYIELVQIENLTTSFQTVTEDLKRRFKVSGEPLDGPGLLGSSFSHGSSPLASGSFRRTLGFELSGCGGGSGTTPFSTSAPVAASRLHMSPGSVGQERAGSRPEGLLSQHMGAAGSAHGSKRGGREVEDTASSSSGVGSQSEGEGGRGGGIAIRARPAPAANGRHRAAGEEGAPRRGGEEAAGQGTAGSQGAPAPSKAGGEGPSSSHLEARLASLLDSQLLLGRQLEEVALQLRLLREAGGRRELGGMAGAGLDGAAGASHPLPAPLTALLPGALPAVFGTAAAGAAVGSALALWACRGLAHQR